MENKFNTQEALDALNDFFTNENEDHVRQTTNISIETPKGIVVITGVDLSFSDTINVFKFLKENKDKMFFSINENQIPDPSIDNALPLNVEKPIGVVEHKGKEYTVRSFDNGTFTVTKADGSLLKKGPFFHTIVKKFKEGDFSSAVFAI